MNDYFDKKKQKNNYFNNEDNDNDNDEFNLINNRIEKEVIYSYECTNNMLLITNIYEGTNECKFELNLKNNGEYTWGEDSKLVYDSNSAIFGDVVRLKPQKPGESSNYTLFLKNTGKMPKGDYKSYLLFYSNGKRYGDKILIKVSIKEKEKVNDDEDMEKVREFRDNFGLSEEDFDDERLLEVLQKYNFQFDKAFEDLFN